MRILFPALALVTATALCVHAAPTTQPADTTMDWLLGSKSTTAPSQSKVEPATTQATSPLISPVKDDTRIASITLSNGQKITGKVYTTGKPIRVWIAALKEFHDYRFTSIKSCQATVLWERMQEEWKFRDEGSDIKEFSGKTYPCRETQYTITLTNGKTVVGSLVFPFYMETPAGERTFLLQKRDKGPIGQPLKDLIYIQQVDFAD